MFVRACLAGSVILCLGGVMVGCASNPALDSVQVSPASQSVTVGQTAQFTAIGTFGNAKSPSTRDITGSVTWTSSVPTVATVNSSGTATGAGAGTTTITASSPGYTGLVSSSATLVVSGASGTTATGAVTSIIIIPGTQTLSAPGATSQFLAVGTTSSGATVNMGGLVAWSSSSTQIATIGASSGLATAVGAGTTTITALYATASGTIVTGTASLSVSGGTTEKYTGVTVTPGAQALSASGQTGQFIALATSGTTGLQTDVTNSPQIKWNSAIPTIVSVSAAGLATGVSPGSTTITAVLTNPDSTVVSGSASVAVSITAPPEPLLSLTIIPNSITVGNLQDTGQFLAIGTFSSAPYVRDLTNSVTWISSEPNYFPISTNNSTSHGNSNAGVINAWWSGGAMIIAEATAPDGSVQTATATFNCPLTLPNPNGNPPTPGTCFPGSEASALISTLTVYNEGLNTTGWVVTAPSATGTANVLHCGPGWPANSGGSVCTATYPVGTVVTVTAPTESGVNFGGWSDNCTPTAPVTSTGPNSCKVSLTSDDAVGGIFN